MELIFIITALMLSFVVARAETTFSLDGREISKLEAVTTLIKKPEAKVMKCSAVELTDKVTLKNRKKVETDK